MRLLYASERPPYPFFLGGAARSAHCLMALLASEHDVECLAVGAGDFAKSDWSCPVPTDFKALSIKRVEDNRTVVWMKSGYSVRILENFKNSFAELLDNFDPDVVWTQLDGVPHIVEACYNKGVRTIVFLRDAEDPPDKIRHIASKGVEFVVNSKFLSKHVQMLTGQRAEVIYPSLYSQISAVGSSNGYITMINPHRVKGLNTFLSIARRMPTQRFLLVESWVLNDADITALEEQLSELLNITFMHRIPDVERIYKQTRLLLVPSVWEEAFGRVVIEAQSCGIPVIASSRGGLPESVGNGGVLIDDYLDVDTWVEEIQSVLGDETKYQELSARAFAHASSPIFSPPYLAQRFLEICLKKPSRRSGVERNIRNVLGRLKNIWNIEK